LVTRRLQLIAILVAERNRLAQSPAAILQSIDTIIEALTKELDRIGCDMAGHVQANFADLSALLDSVRGVGKTTISTLICEVPELGRLSRREISALIGVAPVTPARREQIDFTDKLYAGPARLVAPAGSALQPTADSLRGHRVGVQQGSVQESYARAEWAPKGVTIVSYQSPDQIYEDLSTGRLDALFQTAVQADLGFLRTPHGKSFAFAGAEVKDKRAAGEGVAIGARKGDTQLTAKINKAIESIRKNGTYDRLEHKYFNFDIYGD
jgi:Bacterial extracellular solute-binding proteins, family 3/Transposase IS116/IS110/IS902 family